MNWALQHRFNRFRVADKSGEVTRAWRGEVGDGSSDSRYLLVKRLKASGSFTPGEIAAIVCSRRWYNRLSQRHRLDEDVRKDAIRSVQRLP